MSQNDSLSDRPSVPEVLSACEALLRAGRVGEVAALIAKLAPLSRIPRDMRHRLAKVCRRAGLVEQGLRLLHPIIRAEKPLDIPSTSDEIAEYAFLLARNGSKQEALTLLENMDYDQCPSALLYRASCEIENWNYAQAAVLLERYAGMAVDKYSLLIGRVNLIASHLALGELEKAATLLGETKSLAEQEGAVRLVGNCHELSGNLYVQTGDLSRARAALDEAKRIFGKTESYDQLLSLKWRAIVDALESRSLQPLQSFRVIAASRRHWESVREADLFSLKIHYDQRSFDHLFFGTPLPGFRAWMERQVAGHPSEVYFLGSVTPDLELDIETGRVRGVAGELNAGKKIHQVLSALIADFYAPRNMGSLFAQLYPGEYFNVQSSPNRVRQILHRTRKWLEDENVPAVIDYVDGRYSLAIHGSFAIRVPLARQDMDSHSLRWQQLQRSFPQGVRFSAKEAAARLGLPHTSFHRFVQWAVEKGLLLKIGNGKSTVYEMVPSVNAMGRVG